jgi:hypothetical protein
MDENKDKLISDIYYYPGGYGSVKNTYGDVVKKDSSSTLAYVKYWFKTPTYFNYFIWFTINSFL